MSPTIKALIFEKKVMRLLAFLNPLRDSSEDFALTRHFEFWPPLGSRVSC